MFLESNDLRCERFMFWIIWGVWIWEMFIGIEIKDFCVFIDYDWLCYMDGVIVLFEIFYI